MSATCDCRVHGGRKNPTEIGRHRFTRFMGKHPELGISQYRWGCSCGRDGTWTVQSPNVPYHRWIEHVERAQRRDYLRQIEEMYS